MTKKRWPFLESPGDFAARLKEAYFILGGDMLAAVRNCLIENPPMLASATAPASGGVDAVAVKALEWEQITPQVCRAETIFGTATIMEVTDSYFVWRLSHLATGSEETRDGAERMLWATYEARIRSALTPAATVEECRDR